MGSHPASPSVLETEDGVWFASRNQLHTTDKTFCSWTPKGTRHYTTPPGVARVVRARRRRGSEQRSSLVPRYFSAAFFSAAFFCASRVHGGTTPFSRA